jgi:hypothetical protein
MLILPQPRWRARQAAHEDRVDRWLADHREQRGRHGTHAIGEFLFTYYSFRPAQLRRWQPGLGVALAGADPEEIGRLHKLDVDGHVVVDLETVLVQRSASIKWIHQLLLATASRPAHLGCFGMHEWAMVYGQRQDEIRHSRLPLRLGIAGSTAVVAENRVRCSHFDAFRFFTEPARPLNELQPSRETQTEHDQPGCLHANMDVYRWAYKLSPLVGSDLIADCFEMAGRIRVLDMQASPYDVSEQGFPAVAVETAAGKAEYARRQRAFAEQVAPLRQRLIEICAAALSGVPAG